MGIVKGFFDFDFSRSTKQFSEAIPATLPDTCVVSQATKRTRASRSYGGARLDRTLADWLASGTSADSEIVTSLGPLRRRSRQLCRDNDYARAAKRNIVENVVGTGMRYQSRIRGGDGLDSRLNEQVENAFLEWMTADNCHCGGTLAFQEIEDLVMESVIESGECIIRFIDQAMGTSKVPLAIELIEADQIADEFNGHSAQYSQIASGNHVRMGIEYNQWKRPQAYWLLPNHPGDYQFLQNVQGQKLMRVPADQILHPFVSERIGQGRGVPWFYSALKRLHHLGAYEESEIIAARAAAAIMGFLESEDGGEYQGDEEDEDGNPIERFEPGTIRALRPGEKFNLSDPQRPGNNFDPFVRFMLRGFSAGVGTSYASTSGDLGQASYSSERVGMLAERSHYRRVQWWNVRSFQSRVSNRFLDAAVMAGELAIPKYFTQRATIQRSNRWTPRGWNWIDPQKEITAQLAAISGGLTTRTQVIAETSGRDYEEVLEELAEEKRLQEQYGIAFVVPVNGQQPQQQQPPKETDDGSVNQ